MSNFKDKQLEFLIELARNFACGLRGGYVETKQGSAEYGIPLGEIIVENFHVSGNKNKLLERIKQEFRKRVESGVCEIKELIEDGKDIYESLTGGPGELGAKLFLSFLMTKEEKQEVAENIINYYLKGASDYKRKDFDLLPSDEELFQLIS